MKNKNYRSISEVSDLLKIKQHVIRYWDHQFDGISTRLGDRKRRYFSSKNVKKLQTLINLLHTNGRSHYSIEMARKILKDNYFKKNLNLSYEQIEKKSYINQLSNISENLKNILK